MSAFPVLCDTLQALAPYQLHLQVSADNRAPEDGYWLDRDRLTEPEAEPLATLLTRFGALGFGANRRAAAASLLLRFGWAAGFAIGSYMICRRVPLVHDYTLAFSPHTLLKRLVIREAQFAGAANDPLAGQSDWARTHEPEALRPALVESLVAFTDPLVRAQRTWSGFSRHALWSMVTSSWGAQFASVARQLGDPDRGIREAEAAFALVPELKKAAPHLYEIAVGNASSTCQKRAACCLYFKSPGRPFCASCPIIPEAERLERNRAFVAQQAPLVSA